MAMIGGARWPGAVDAPDDALAARLAAGLERTLGLRALPPPVALSRWPRAVAQPGVDHPRRIARLRELAAARAPPPRRRLPRRRLRRRRPRLRHPRGPRS